MHVQTGKARMFKVVTPIEKKGGGTYWMRVGTAFPAKDGSTALNLFLDAVPTGANKMLHVREMDDEDFQKSDRRVDRRINEPMTAEAAGGDLPF